MLSLHLPQQPVSTMTPTLERSTPPTSPAATHRPSSPAAKSSRALACALCQKRKVKCDRRKSPCANCIRSQAQCVPAPPPVTRQRRQRFPERELLDRLRYYETLLRRSNINFEPLHTKDASTREERSLDTDRQGPGCDSQDDEQLVATAGIERPSSPTRVDKPKTVYEAKYALALLRKIHLKATNNLLPGTSGTP